MDTRTAAHSSASFGISTAKLIGQAEPTCSGHKEKFVSQPLDRNPSNFLDKGLPLHGGGACAYFTPKFGHGFTIEHGYLFDDQVKHGKIHPLQL